MTLRPSPVVGLNRAIAISLHEGPKRGLEEINAMTPKVLFTLAAAATLVKTPWRWTHSCISEP
jgi:predicted RNA polymerase sigma factor